MEYIKGISDRFSGLTIVQKIGSISILVGILIFSVRAYNANAAQKYETYQVKKEDITESVEVSGNVQSAAEAPVSTTTTGIIEEIYVENGDMVSQGQNLFKVRSTATDAEKAAAYASYMAALNNSNTNIQNKPLYQSQLEAARKGVIDAQNAVNAMNSKRSTGSNNPTTGKEYTREEIDSLYSALTSSQQNFTSLERKFKDSDSGISSGKASVNSTWLAYQATQDSVVTAPMSGTIINLANSLGDKVTASTSLTTAAPILTVAKLDTLTIKVQINEGDISKLDVGQTTTIVLDALKDKTFTGSILRLDTKGTSNQGVVTYNGYVQINDPDPLIKPMMTATVKIEATKRSQVLTVPNIDIMLNQGEKSVKILEKGKLIFVPVTLGVKGLTKTEIVKGLSEGQQVVINSK